MPKFHLPLVPKLHLGTCISPKLRFAAFRPAEVQLRQHLRYQVKLGNEGMKNPPPMKIPIPSFFTAAILLLCLLPASARADILYVSSYNGHSITKFTSDGIGSVFATGLVVPLDLAFDLAGNLYVRNANDTILKFSAVGVSSVFVSSISGRGLAFDSEGNLYASRSGNNMIEKFTPAGVPSVFVSGLSGPADLAFDSAGNLFVSCGNNTIQKITPGGVVSVFASSGVNQPRGLAFDRAGNLYVAISSGSTIRKYTPSGGVSVFATSASGLAGPAGLAFDSAGNLYVANFPAGASTVEMFTSAGVGAVAVTRSKARRAPWARNAVTKVQIGRAHV